MDQERVYPFRTYFWMVRSETSGKIVKTRHRMSEAEALARYPGAVRVETDSMLIKGPIEVGPNDHLRLK
jgi:hypothetical protein